MDSKDYLQKIKGLHIYKNFDRVFNHCTISVTLFPYKMRLNSFGYRLIWSLKRRFFRCKDTCGPMPIVEGEPCRHFIPPASVSDAIRQQNCPEQLVNFERLCAQLQLVPRLTSYLPNQLAERDWHHLLEMDSVKERLEYLCFLVKRNKIKLKTEQKKQQKSAAKRRGEKEEEEDEDQDELGMVDDERRDEQGEAEVAECNDDNITSRPWRNKVLVVPYTSNAERIAASHRYIRSLQLAETPRIAIDCRFLNLHSSRGLSLTMRQLQMLLASNRDRQCPWPIHLCNFSSADTVLDTQRRKHLHSLDGPRCITAEVHSNSYTELFKALRNAQKIVYLSPHSGESLTRIDADACYVIGAIVDRAHEPRIPLRASLLVSEVEQLPCRRLPIPPEFLRGGNPLLTLVQVLAILQHVFHSPNGDDWQGAFEQHIPKRKRLSPAEKNTKMRLRYTNINARNREVARIVEERTLTAAGDLQKRDQKTVGMRFLSKLFG